MELAELLKELDGYDLSRSRLLRLVALGEPLIPHLMTALQNTNHRIAHHSAIVLQHIGSAAALPTLAFFLADIDHNYQAIEILKALRDPRTVEPLLVKLAEPATTDAQQQKIIRILEAIGDLRAAPNLLHLLQHSISLDLQRNVLFALGRIRALSFADEIIPYLEHETLGFAALWTLGALGDLRYRATIEAKLNDPAVLLPFKSSLIDAIGISQDRYFASLVMHFLHEVANDKIQEHMFATPIIKAAGQVGDHQTIDLLMQIVRNLGSYLDEALDAVVQIGGDYARAKLLEQLGGGFSWWDEWREGHNAVIKATAKFGTVIVENLITILEQASSPYYRAAAAEVLCLIDDPRVLPALIASLERRDSAWRSGSILRRMGHFRDERLVNAILEGLRTNLLSDQHAADALAEMEISAQLLRMLDDPSENVKSAAIQGLRTAKKVSGVVEKLLPLLPDKRFRWQIINTLRLLDNPLALDALIEFGGGGHGIDGFIQRHGDATTVDKVLAQLAVEPESFLVSALDTFLEPRLIEPLKQIYAQLQDIRIRQIVLRQLIRLGETWALEDYVALLDHPKNDPAHLLKALISLHPPNLLNILREFVEHPRQPEQLHAFHNALEVAYEQLGKMDEAGLPVLLAALRSSIPLHRDCAVEYINPTTHFTLDEVVAMLIPQLADEANGRYSNQRICDTTANRLERLATPAALAAVQAWRDTH